MKCINLIAYSDIKRIEVGNMFIGFVNLCHP